MEAVQRDCVEDERSLPVLFRVLEQYRSWIEGKGAQIMCSAVLTVRCSLDLSFLVVAPNKTVMEVHGMDSMTVV